MKHIPNIISVVRIGLIPFFVYQLLHGKYLEAGIILVFSGLSDALDGFLARRFNWVSQVGKILDPVADKLTQVSMCLTIGYLLGQRYRWIWWFFAVILLKEVLMLTLGADLMRKGVQIQGAKWAGKVNTVMFYLTMAVLVFFPEAPKQLIAVLLTATTGCAIYAALAYIPDYKKYRDSLKKKDE